MMTLERWRAMTREERVDYPLTTAERAHLIEESSQLPPDYVPRTEGVLGVAVNGVPCEMSLLLQPVCAWRFHTLEVTADDLDALVLVSVRSGREEFYHIDFDDPKISLRDIAHTLRGHPYVRIWPNVGLLVVVRNTGPHPQKVVLTAPGAPITSRDPIFSIPTGGAKGGFEFL